MQGLLSIGRFSQACRLSVRTLRRYDADGLLVPALVDPRNGRRYYSPAQLDEARLIRLLRGLELPLEEVRGVLAEPEPQAARRRLAAHRDRLAQQLAHQQTVLADLDELLADPRPVTGPEVTRRTLAAEPVLSVRLLTSLAGFGPAFGAALGRLDRVLEGQFGHRTGPPLAIYHGADFDPEAMDVEVAVPVTEGTRGGSGVEARVLPAVDAVTLVHAGPYDGLGSAYRTLAAWAAGHGCELGDQPRESYLVGPDRCPPDGWRTEVAWPLA